MKAYYYENNGENGVMLINGTQFIAYGTQINGIWINRENLPQIVHQSFEEPEFDNNDFDHLFNVCFNSIGGAVAGLDADPLEDQDYTELIYVSRDDPESEDEGEDDAPEEDDDDDDEQEDETRRDYDYLLDLMQKRADQLAQRVNDLYACAAHQGRRAAKYEARGDKKKTRECENKMNDFFAVARHLQSAARVLGFAWIEDHFTFVCDPDF